MERTSAARRWRHSLGVGERPDAFDRAAHEVAESRANLLAAPEEALDVLHPLEVRDGHAARVREDVGEHRDPPLGEDRVGVERRRPVRALGDQARSDVSALAPLTWFSVAARTRTSHGSTSSSAFVTCSASSKPERSRCSRRQPSTFARSSPAGSWMPPAMSETAVTRAAVRELVGGHGTHLAVALDDTRCVGDTPTESPDCLLDDHDDADAGRLGPGQSRRPTTACP